MKHLLWCGVLLFLMLAPGLVRSQGVRYDIPPILNQRGGLVANAAISLCPGTATINGSTSTVTCTPAAQSFTDATLATQCPVSLPVTLTLTNTCQATSDFLGNAGFWLAPGSYIYCVNSPSIVGKCYNLTVAGSTLLSHQSPVAPLTGNSADLTVYTYTVSANVLQAGKCLRITVAWLHSSGTATVTYKLKSGATTVFNGPISSGVDNTQHEYTVYEICNQAGVQNVQDVVGRKFARTAAVGNVSLNAVEWNQGTSTLDFTLPQTVTFTFNVSNTDQVTGKTFMVELIQ